METETTMEIKTELLARGDTWAWPIKGRRWHRVVKYEVYAYPAMGGGWGAIVNARFACGDMAHVGEINQTHLRSGQSFVSPCPKCVTSPR
jgi:hypothetical protein